MGRLEEEEFQSHSRFLTYSGAFTCAQQHNEGIFQLPRSTRRCCISLEMPTRQHTYSSTDVLLRNFLSIQDSARGYISNLININAYNTPKMVSTTRSVEWLQTKISPYRRIRKFKTNNSSSSAHRPSNIRFSIPEKITKQEQHKRYDWSRKLYDHTPAMQTNWTRSSRKITKSNYSDDLSSKSAPIRKMSTNQ